MNFSFKMLIRKLGEFRKCRFGRRKEGENPKDSACFQWRRVAGNLQNLIAITLERFVIISVFAKKIHLKHLQ